MGKSMKSKTKKKKSKLNHSYDKEVIGIAITVVGLIILLSLLNVKMGIVGFAICNIFNILMGLGSYLFALFTIGIGLILISNKFNLRELKVILSISLIFISILIIFDSVNPSNMSLISRISKSIDLGRMSRGGGIIGSFFGFFFYKLFDRVGTYLILLSTIIVNLLIITNLQFKSIYSNLKTKYKKLYQEKQDTKSKVSKRKQPTNHKKNIQISNYVKSENKVIENTKVKNPSIEKDLKPNELINNNENVSSPYDFPSLDLLNNPVSNSSPNDEQEILGKARIIEETMKNFGIDASITQINKGPTITCYELEPAPGIKLSKIVSLSDNIALSLASSDIRIEAPIPGKAAVGIEVPNKTKDSVLFKEIITSNEYSETESSVPLALGKNVSGKVIISSIDKMPHLLIAGATGSGKSVCINTIITSILYKSPPEDVKLLLIDPKVVELSIYNGIPHLLIPVVTDAKKAAFALNWAVEEMEKRYKKFAENNVRDITSYNNKTSKNEDKLPRIVIIIDELADLMMVSAQEIEDYICRLAQMARAAGMYLIVATQRPSVDVITGTIKANIPSRISFAVSSNVDSRTILDTSGAEKLLGKGDMLFYPSFYSKPLRVQGAFISDGEVESIVEFLKSEHSPNYNDEIINVVENSKDLSLGDTDELLLDAINIILEEGQASISMLQRKLKIGYTRAARIIDQMEEQGIVGGHEGSKPRKVLISTEELDSTLNKL